MNDSKVDQVLEAICSLADSLLTPIIGDLATCVIQCEEAGRRSSSGMSPRAAMAAEDVKVEMHEVLGKAKQYVHSCKDVASYVCESGVLAEVEKDLSSGRIEELDSFLSDVGDYFTHCLSRLKQFVATEMRFRTKVGHQRSLPSSQSPLSVQDVPCGRESEVYCRVGVFVGTAVSLVVLMRQTGRESWASIGSLFFAAALSSLLRPQGVFGTCQLYCRMGTLVGTTSLALVLRQMGWGSPYSIASLYLASFLSSFLHPQGTGCCRTYSRAGTLIGTGSLALLINQAGLGNPFFVGSLYVASLVAFLIGERWLIAAPEISSRSNRMEEGSPPGGEVLGFCNTMERVHRNAEAMYGSFETAKSLVDGWVKRTAQRGQSDDVDYEKIRASIRRLQSSMAKALKEVNVYLK
eukprot:Em0024g480a